MTANAHRAVRSVHPLFNKSSADLILRSSDGVDFYVLKAIMGEASSVLEDMLMLPQPGGIDNVEEDEGEGDGDGEEDEHDSDGEDDDSDSDTRVTEMTEDARTIEHVLRFIYPVEPPDIAELRELFAVLEMSTKFMLTCVEKLAMRQYAGLARKHPLRAYALACKWRREDAMRVAARASLAHPIPDGSKYLKEMEDITAGSYIRLHRYHASCSAAVAALNPSSPGGQGITYVSWIKTAERPWFTTNLSKYRQPQVEYYQLNISGLNMDVRPADWWLDCVADVFERLKATPDPQILESSFTIGRFIGASKTSSAGSMEKSKLMATALSEFFEEFSDAIQRMIARVKLEVR